MRVAARNTRRSTTRTQRSAASARSTTAADRRPDLAGCDRRQLGGHVSADRPPFGERPGRAPHPRSDPTDEIPLDALAHRLRSPLPLKALEVEAEPLGPLPQMRVVDPPAL